MLVYAHPPTKFEQMVWPLPYSAILGRQSHPTRNTEFLKTGSILGLVPLKLQWPHVSHGNIKQYEGRGAVDLGRGTEFALLMLGLLGDEGTEVQSHTLRSKGLVRDCGNASVRDQSRSQFSHGKVRQGYMAAEKHQSHMRA